MTDDLGAVRLAAPADGPHILGLRSELEHWLAGRGIQQWNAGEVTLSDLTAQLARDEWHVLRSGTDLAGALRILWSDALVWQDKNTFAVYVHGLMVHRSYAGQHVGAHLLRWAGQQGRTAGARELRLDCVESNHPLRDYYARQGFTEVGRRDFAGDLYSAVLLTKPLT
jgi:GNAT superfamily N-acetyltransferase